VKTAPLLMMAALLAGCATQDRLTTVDTRSENVGHQRLQPQAGGGSGQVQTYSLGASEGYRMPQLYAAPDPEVGDRDPRAELAPTTICLQVVVDAQGSVERSVPLTDRPECAAGAAGENAPLLQPWRCGSTRPQRSATSRLARCLPTVATVAAPSASSRWRSPCSMPLPSRS